jgi:hypothetical protein
MRGNGRRSRFGWIVTGTLGQRRAAWLVTKRITLLLNTRT